MCSRERSANTCKSTPIALVRNGIFTNSKSQHSGKIKERSFANAKNLIHCSSYLIIQPVIFSIPDMNSPITISNLGIPSTILSVVTLITSTHTSIFHAFISIFTTMHSTIPLYHTIPATILTPVRISPNHILNTQIGRAHV